jgi:2-polyprenyl-6-hydroxyphenyl methylase / 3-demethylubiquinone-9 3-methyltransferase
VGKARTNAKTRATGTVDADEIEGFAKFAHDWWDPEGAFRPLHRLNPARLRFLRDHFAAHFGRDPKSHRPFRGLTLLDIGCGGGIVAEPMARLGFNVTGIDADATTIAVARAHARGAGLKIDYREAAAEDLARAKRRFDAVVALEVVEHASDPGLFLETASALVRPGGAFAASTLNRTAKAFLIAILGAEYLLRWLPRGTHQWSKFVRPSELAAALRRGRLEIGAVAGLGFDPLRGEWRVGGRPDVNYLLFASKPAGK